MKKRSLISIVILMFISSVMLTSFFACKPSRKFIGIQLYSIRDSIERDVPAAITKVGKMGYSFVEPAGYWNGKFYGMEPAAFKTLCKSNGLRIMSSHTGQELPDSAHMAGTMVWWDSCITAHIVVGAKYIVQPFMGGGAYRSLDTLKLYCNYFNMIGDMCNAKGIRFGYHNHSEEFKTQFNGESVYDFMLQNTDPSKVIFEMDLYWAVEGGAKPVEYFNKYPGRFELWHIKDAKEVGASGKMDFEGIWAGSAKSGMKYGVVEVEEYDFDEFTSCQKSFDFLNTAIYVKMPKNK